MGEKIFITGATGTVGSEVVKQLTAAGAEVRAAVHSVEKAYKIKPFGVKTVELDYDKPDSFGKAFEGIAKLFVLTPVQNIADKMVEHTKIWLMLQRTVGFSILSNSRFYMPTRQKMLF